MQPRLRDENGLSPTRAIYHRLKPLWRSRVLDDQDWAYILVCLKDIETGQKKRCMDCIDRKMIEAI